MNENNHEHEETINGVKKQFHEILDHSDQAIYIYLDDNHKICNQKFSSLLGYASPEEWAAVTESFPTAFVAEKSQESLVSHYQDAMEKKISSQAEITWKKKDDGEVNSKVILVPIAFDGKLLALHFIEQF